MMINTKWGPICREPQNYLSWKTKWIDIGNTVHCQLFHAKISSNLFNSRVCLSTEWKYCGLKINFVTKLKWLFRNYIWDVFSSSFLPFPPLKLVFLQETLSSFAISRSLHMSPSQTMMMMIHNDDRWVMMMILPVESLKQREGNRPAFHTRSLPGTTWIIMVNVMTMEVLLIMMIMIILMTYVARYRSENDQMCCLYFVYFCVFILGPK